MNKFRRDCEKCLHSEVCKLIEPVNLLEESMGVVVEDCPHFLSAVNWAPEEETSTEGLHCGGNCAGCSDNARATEVKEDIYNELAKSIVMGLTQRHQPQLRKYVVAPCETEKVDMLIIDVANHLVHKGHRPVSVTLTTPQFHNLFKGVPTSLNSGGLYAMTFGQTTLEVGVNDNINSAYISYIENKETR